MAYRETARTRAKAEARRARIERGTHRVIASGGFASASIAAVAREAQCSAGLIYTYYENRDELLGIVFARAAGHELSVVETAISDTSDAAGLVDAVVDVFIRRAVAGRILAHALLFEEVPDTVQIERRALRRGYVTAIASRLDELSTAGISDEAVDRVPAGAVGRTPAEAVGHIPAEVVARSLVGSVSENLVDVLDPAQPDPSTSDVEALITALSTFARTALGDQ